MKNEKNSVKEPTQHEKNRKRLRITAVLTGCVSVLHIAAIVCLVLQRQAAGTCSGGWFNSVSLFIKCTIAAFAAIEFYRLTHYRGNYRCEVCGHVHTPSEEALVEMLVDSKKPDQLHCPVCGEHSKHRKCSGRETVQYEQL